MNTYKLPKIEELYTAGVHFGHQLKRWNPKMEEFIYSAQKGLHIIDLSNTETQLKKACDHLYEVAKRGEQVIFVGTKKQAREVIEIEAKRAGAMYVSERWLGGTITNQEQIKKTVDTLLSNLAKKEKGEFAKYTKKERLMIDRDIEKMQKAVGGLVGLKNKPSAMFVIDSKREATAIKEANVSGVTVIGLVDTNSDPTHLDIAIPGNDDAIKSIVLITKALTDAIVAGYEEFAKISKEKKIEKEAVKVEVKIAPKAEVKPEAKVAPKTEKEAAKEVKPTAKEVKKDEVVEPVKVAKKESKPIIADKKTEKKLVEKGTKKVTATKKSTKSGKSKKGDK